MFTYQLIQMKTKTFLMLMLYAFLGQLTLAQTDKKVRISGISAQVGQISLPYQSLNVADFRKIVPQSKILQKDYTNFTEANGSGQSGSPIFSMLLGLEFGKKDKKGHPELRLGFNYFTSQDFTVSLSSTSSKRCDTLISTQTGQMFFLDSIHVQNSYARSSSEQLRFDASYLYRTNPDARFSGFLGIGTTLGTSLNSQTFVSAYDYKYKATLGTSPTSFITRNNAFEYFTNKNNIVSSVYIPLGCDLRIVKKKPIWSGIHLFYETRAGVNIASVPNYGLMKGVFLQHGLGLKFKI